jgi:hypothetical protein
VEDHGFDGGVVGLFWGDGAPELREADTRGEQMNMLRSQPKSMITMRAM